MNVAEVGQVYNAKVKRIESMVLLLNCLPVKMLYYTSQISKERINKVEDVLSIGDSIDVKITEIDKQGRVNLLIKH